MKYPYIVTKNGKRYPAGAEVPEDTPKADQTVEKPEIKSTGKPKQNRKAKEA